MMPSSAASSSISSHAPVDTRPAFSYTLIIPAPSKSLTGLSTYVSAASAAVPVVKRMPSCPLSLSLIPRWRCPIRLRSSGGWRMGTMISPPSCSAALPSTRITLKQLSAITSGTGGSVCFPSPFRLIPLRTSLPAVSCTINTSLCRLKKRSMSFLYKPHNHTRQPYFYLL